MGGFLALATGFGNGYLDEKRQQQMDAERQTDRANRQQEFDAQMDDVKQAKNLRLSLADAGRPATVNDNAAMLDVSGKPAVYEDPGVANSDYRQARTMGLADVQAPRQTAAVNGNAYGSTGEANAAAVAYNQPEAQQQRIGQAYAKAGQPMQAMQYQAAQQGLRAGQTHQQNAEFQLKKAQEERARQFQDEGAIDTAKMASTGNAQGVYDTFNAQGKVKLDAVPQVTQRDREIPGVGTVPTYDYEGSVTGPDGQSIPFKRNSHDMRMQTMAFEKQMEMMRKASLDQSSMRLNDSHANFYNASAALKEDTDPNLRKTGGSASGFKPLAPEKVSQIVETMGGKTILPPNPFQDPKAAMMNNGKVPADDTGRAAFQQLFGMHVENSGDGGNITASMNRAKTQYTKLNAAITQKLQQDFEGVFDNTGKSAITPEVAKGVVAKYGFDPTGMNRYQVMTNARDAALRDSVDRLTSGDQVAAPQPASASPGLASARPTTPARQPTASSPQPQAAAPMSLASAVSRMPPAQQATPASPVEAAGQQVDQARAALESVLRSPRPGLAAGRPAIDAYAAKVSAARSVVAQAEGEYQKLVPTQRPAYAR